MDIVSLTFKATNVGKVFAYTYILIIYFEYYCQIKALFLLSFISIRFINSTHILCK